jgi:hypothetical protein
MGQSVARAALVPHCLPWAQNGLKGAFRMNRVASWSQLLKLTYQVALALLGGLAASGCATIQKYRLPAEGMVAYPKKVILVEMPMLVDERALNKLFTPDFPQESAESRQAVETAVRNAHARALAAMPVALKEQAPIEVDDREAVSRAVDELHINGPDAVTREAAGQLRAVSEADALLRFRITDYGITPKSWRKGVITFEVLSTLGIAALAYAYPRTRALAGAYLVEESIEETAWAYGGFWTLDEVCRPVRIEAELIDLKTGTQVWNGSATGLSDVRLSRVFRKVGKAERDAQLNTALDEAVEKIAADLGEVFSQGIIGPPGDARGK